MTTRTMTTKRRVEPLGDCRMMKMARLIERKELKMEMETAVRQPISLKFQ
jgi:hypothetical protein